MKKIKERAREFVDAPCDHRCKKCNMLPATCRFYNDQMSFIAGAESEHEELTRWHDPKEAMPANDREVLCKIDGFAINHIVLKHNNLGWWMHAPRYSGWCACAFNVLVWREIHE